MRRIALMLPVFCLSLAACSSAGLPPSAVSGALVTASFPATPTAVRATDEAGRVVEGGLDTSANFALSLAAGHSYRLDVLSGGTATPIVFPRALGRLDTTFRVAGLGALISLGSVRRMEIPPATTFALLSSTPGEVGENGECVDGYLDGTTTPCVDDDGAVVCAPGEDDDDEEDDDDVAEGEDGECTDGVDAASGASCVDEAEVEQIDDAPAGAVAVPEHNVPDTVDGCGDDEEDDD